MNGNGQERVDAVGESISTLVARLEPHLEQAKATLAEWNKKAMQLMRERPGACLACAVGIGFLVGRLASRR